jgi:hypothetical protein
MRTTKEVRERLERAAAESGRSLVQEVEHRLDSSFRDEIFFEFVGGHKSEAIVRPILYYLGSLEHQGLNWRSDPAAVDAVREAIGLITEAIFLGPLSQKRQTSFLLGAALEHRGEKASGATRSAVAVLSLLGLAEPPPPEGSAA